MLEGDASDTEAPDERAVRDVAAPKDDEYEDPLMVESSVGEEEMIDEAIDDVLTAVLDIVEFVVSAAVRAATIDGSLLAATLDAEDEMTASAATAPMLDEANGYAGTVSVLGNAGTDGTEGSETLGTAGTDGTEGRAMTVATVGSADTDGTDNCDVSAGVDGTTDRVSDGRDAIDGNSSVEAASAAAATATAVGTDDPATTEGAETSVASVTGRAWLVSVGAVESSCVTVVCATTFPAVSTVATTSTFIVFTFPVPSA